MESNHPWSTAWPHLVYCHGVALSPTELEVETSQHQQLQMQKPHQESPLQLEVKKNRIRAMRDQVIQESPLLTDVMNTIRSLRDQIIRLETASYHEYPLILETEYRIKSMHDQLNQANIAAQVLLEPWESNQVLGIVRSQMRQRGVSRMGFITR